jgi:hypothetical protein
VPLQDNFNRSIFAASILLTKIMRITPQGIEQLLIVNYSLFIASSIYINVVTKINLKQLPSRSCVGVGKKNEKSRF